MTSSRIQRIVLRALVAIVLLLLAFGAYKILSPIFHDLKDILRAVGYIGLFAIVFAESGLFFGFFLPGDSLLVTAGILASQGEFDLTLLLILLIVAAISGDSVGYWFGRKVGPRIFNKKDSLFFHKDHLYRAQAFYEKHGGKTIVLARFMPLIRTFAPIVAGVGNMKYTTFLFYNVFGGFLWVLSMTLAGYYLGKAVEGVDKYLIPLIVAIVLISVAPGVVHFYKENPKFVKEKLRSLID